MVRDIWLPLGLAFLLATVLDPIVDKLEARGMSRTWASVIIFTAFLVIVIGGLFLLIPAMVGQAGSLQESFSKYFPDTSPKGLRKSLVNMHLSEAAANVVVSAMQSFMGGIQKTSSWLTDYGMRFVSNLIWVVIVPIVAFYALRDYHLILGKGLLLVPARRRDATQTYIAEVTTIFAKYLRGLGLVSIMNGAATYVLLLVLRCPGSLVLGAIAGVLYSVPYVGALLTIVLTAGVAFASGGPSYALLVVSLSIVLHQIVFDQIISPRVLGGQVGLHPILSIVALLAGNLLLGIIGMILAVPIAACIQIGIVAMIPKLAEDIEIDHATIEKAEHNEEEHGALHMHETVVKAVERVERKIEEGDQ